MKSLTTAADSSKESTFVPMTESQMESTRGGLDFGDVISDQEIMDALVDWVEGHVNDPTSIIGQILSQFSVPSLDDDYWNEVSDELSDEGYSWPTLEQLEQHAGPGTGGF